MGTCCALIAIIQPHKPHVVTWHVYGKEFEVKTVHTVMIFDQTVDDSFVVLHPKGVVKNKICGLLFCSVLNLGVCRLSNVCTKSQGVSFPRAASL